MAEWYLETEAKALGEAAILSGRFRMTQGTLGDCQSEGLTWRCPKF